MNNKIIPYIITPVKLLWGKKSPHHTKYHKMGMLQKKKTQDNVEIVMNKYLIKNGNIN